MNRDSPDHAGAVCAVIVTHHPDLARLRESLAALQPQVAGVLVVDNTPGGAAGLAALLEQYGARLLQAGQNIGLGAAYNRGIDAARARGARYAVLFDQDSVAAAGMVAALRHAVEREGAEHVAAAGPVHIDARSGAPAPFVRFGFPLNAKCHPRAGNALHCDFLISSGSLIPLHAFERVGRFDEALFIDSVDLEWCMRARRAGLALLGVADARMRHEIGASLRRLPLGLGTTPVHPPLRLHYMTRNRVLLYARHATPLVWTAQDVPRLLFKLFRFGLFVPPRWRNLQAMLRGISDGLSRRSGPVGD